MVEYKQTADGRLILMEINGRPWGSIGLPVACGIDYPRFLIEWSLKGTLPPESIHYRNNVCRRVVGELTHLSNLRSGASSQLAGRLPRLLAEPSHHGAALAPGDVLRRPVAVRSTARIDRNSELVSVSVEKRRCKLTRRSALERGLRGGR